jgi:hypothetical protein
LSDRALGRTDALLLYRLADEVLERRALWHLRRGDGEARRGLNSVGIGGEDRVPAHVNRATNPSNKTRVAPRNVYPGKKKVICYDIMYYTER